MRTALIAGLAALFSAPAFAQNVHMGIGANGQMTGSVSAGGSSSSISTGSPARRDYGYEADPCRNGGSRTTTVVSPDGSSSSSVSVSGNGNGVMTTGGTGSPGSRIYQSGCPERRDYDRSPPQRHTVHHKRRTRR